MLFFKEFCIYLYLYIVAFSTFFKTDFIQDTRMAGHLFFSNFLIVFKQQKSQRDICVYGLYAFNIK